LKEDNLLLRKDLQVNKLLTSWKYRFSKTLLTKKNDLVQVKKQNKI
jgi:hypothetical protein